MMCTGIVRADWMQMFQPELSKLTISQQFAGEEGNDLNQFDAVLLESSLVGAEDFAFAKVLHLRTKTPSLDNLLESQAIAIQQNYPLISKVVETREEL